MRPGLYIDGQRKAREPDRPIDLLDGIGLDRRQLPQPLVVDSTEEAFFRAGGGWIPTVPMDFEGGE